MLTIGERGKRVNVNIDTIRYVIKDTKENFMIIDCYISEGCSSEMQLRDNLKTALADSTVKPEIQFHRIDEAGARKKGLMGSPSVLIDGADILPGEIPGIS